MKSLINTKEISYIRHIEFLPENYNKEAYPKFSVISLNNYIEINKKEFNVLQRDINSYKITSKPPQTGAFIGYPHGSTVHYYINFKKVSTITEYYMNDYFTVFFDNSSKLYIYDNLNNYSNLISSLTLDTFMFFEKEE